ncbi:hypothetical protein VTO42DRAFT_106 [Malbranchea cinnamomea]
MAVPNGIGPRLTRDQRRDILLLRGLGWTYEQITNHLKDVTYRGVQYTCQTNQATPRKPPGRPSQLTEAQVDEIEEFVTASATNRRMPYKTLVRVLDLDWDKILWTGETWINSAKHKKIWVTRRAGEELDPTCVVEKTQRKTGWMFWGSISGHEKGPCLFWDKEWGTITGESYSQRIVPIIHGWMRLRPELQLMQDGAPGHRDKKTLADLAEHGIHPIHWPPYSPDLSPMETIWDKMKDWIQGHYPQENLTYDQLRDAVQKAWDSVSQNDVQQLVSQMQERCQAVLDAHGQYTKF